MVPTVPMVRVVRMVPKGSHGFCGCPNGVFRPSNLPTLWFRWFLICCVGLPSWDNPVLGIVADPEEDVPGTGLTAETQHLMLYNNTFSDS